jgi:hypothetical protein
MNSARCTKSGSNTGVENRYFAFGRSAEVLLRRLECCIALRRANAITSPGYGVRGSGKNLLILSKQPGSIAND